MIGTRFITVVALAAAAVALAGCRGSGSSAGTTSTETTTTGTTTTGTTTTPPAGGTLEGSVGPGFDISLTRSGKAVTTLAPGSYALEVNDKANIHNFHLTGPGVDVSTDVSFTGTKTFQITLQDGSYHYQCDPHSSSLNGDFTVSG